MSEALPQCQPVLLEPILAVEIAVPSEATAKANAIVSSRRGQILGFDNREGWEGWDVVQALIPRVRDGRPHHRASLGDAGRRHVPARFDHLSELTGRQADQIVASRHAAQ